MFTTPPNAFKVVLMNQANCQEIYNALETKEMNTLYILRNGYGYIGDKLLFSGKDVQGVTVTDMNAKDFVPSETDVVSSKAIIDFVANKLNDSALINTHFFRKVENHIITQEEATNAVNKPDDKYYGFEAGTPGLLFTADTDGIDDEKNTIQYFISLKDFVDIYTTENTNSINMSINEQGQITANLNVQSEETILEVTQNGVKINKSIAIPDSGASNDKVATEKAVADYVTKIIQDVLNKVVVYNVQESPTANE